MENIRNVTLRVDMTILRKAVSLVTGRYDLTDDQVIEEWLKHEKAYGITEVKEHANEQG